MSTEQIGVACLGVTHPHASGRTKVMANTPGVRVVGAADDDPVIKPFTRYFGIPQKSVDDLLADPDVHAVLIHSKSHAMVDLSIAALEAGKAVLVEKPGGRDITDLNRLVEAVERTGGVCQVGYNFRYAHSVDLTVQALQQGWLGRVLQSRVHGACSLNEAATSHLNQPGDMGGALFVIGCHVIDLMLHFFGLPDTVNARVPKFPRSGNEKFREDAAAAVFNYPDKVVTLDFFSWDPLPWIETWQISLYGTDGILTTGPLPTRYELYLNQSRGGHPAGWTRWQQSSFPIAWAAEPTEYTPELAEIANMSFFERECAAFLAAARKEIPVTVSAHHARDIVRVIAACYESSREQGRQIPIPGASRASAYGPSPGVTANTGRP